MGKTDNKASQRKKDPSKRQTAIVYGQIPGLRQTTVYTPGSQLCFFNQIDINEWMISSLLKEN